MRPSLSEKKTEELGMLKGLMTDIDSDSDGDHFAAVKTCWVLEASAAITALVILNFIGHGLHPNRAAFHSRKQAMIPKVALKLKLKIWQLANGSRKKKWQ